MQQSHADQQHAPIRSGASGGAKRAAREGRGREGKGGEGREEWKMLGVLRNHVMIRTQHGKVWGR